MVAKRPVAEGALTRTLLRKWRLDRKLWRFSLTSEERATKLKRWGVILYIILLCMYMPIFSFIIVFIINDEKFTANNIYIIFLFIFYGSLSIWAFIESIAVLRRRVKASQERIALRKWVETLEQTEHSDGEDAPPAPEPAEKS